MKYAKITSPANPHIKKAMEVRKKRPEQDIFLVEGAHLIEMALEAGAGIMAVFFTGSFISKKEGQAIVSLLAKKTSEIFETTEHLLDKLTDTKTPQGIAAVVSYKTLKLSELPLKNLPLLVVIDGVQDPGNLGSIIRTSDAAGADAVVLLPGTCDPFMPKTLRSTSGSIFTIPVVSAETPHLLEWLAERKIRSVITSADAKKIIFDTDLKFPAAFVFGNEAHGVSEQMRRAADLFLKIPIIGRAESLNVAASAAICLYEAVRQRSYDG